MKPVTQLTQHVSFGHQVSINSLVGFQDKMYVVVEIQNSTFDMTQKTER